MALPDTRIRISEAEHVALIEASMQRDLLYAFGPGWVELLVRPGDRWALEILAQMRGVPDGMGS